MLLLHLTMALLAIWVGLLQLLMRKGTAWHKKMGWVWIVVMAVTASSSFALTGFGGEQRFSWLHGLSLWTLICLVAMVYFARQRNFRRHRRFAVGAYIGLVAAGIAAVMMQNRLLHIWLFG